MIRAKKYEAVFKLVIVKVMPR